MYPPSRVRSTHLNGVGKEMNAKQHYAWKGEKERSRTSTSSRPLVHRFSFKVCDDGVCLSGPCFAPGMTLTRERRSTKNRPHVTLSLRLHTHSSSSIQVDTWARSGRRMFVGISLERNRSLGGRADRERSDPKMRSISNMP